jgi:RNA polymerase sigma-70 factor (ECF subfamily)
VGLANTDFRLLVERYAGVLYRSAVRLARHRQDAEDLVQETFARAWRARATFRAGGNPRAWLLRIMRNARAEALRRSGRMPGPLLIMDVESLEHARAKWLPWITGPQNPEELLIEGLLSGPVAAALGALPRPFLLSFVLAELHGLPYAEVGRVLGLPLGTVRRRIARARRLLRRALLDVDGGGRVVQGRATASNAPQDMRDAACLEVRRSIYQFLDCELDPTTLGRVSAHVAACRPCAEGVAFQRRLWREVCAHRPRMLVPQTLRQRLDWVLATSAARCVSAVRRDVAT